MAKEKNPKFEVYKAKDGWRWRLFAKNGRIVAESGEAYRNKPDARSTMKALDRHMLAVWRKLP